jgi:hypothetical protein
VVVDLLVVLVVVLAVAVVVSAPLRGGGRGGGERPARADVAELEAAKEAKYREIRDAELDFQTGKLSREDYEALDRGLRGEAVALLRRLDEAHDREAEVR